jgi:hypothetical protein
MWVAMEVSVDNEYDSLMSLLELFGGMVMYEKLCVGMESRTCAWTA